MLPFSLHLYFLFPYENEERHEGRKVKLIIVHKCQMCIVRACMCTVHVYSRVVHICITYTNTYMCGDTYIYSGKMPSVYFHKPFVDTAAPCIKGILTKFQGQTLMNGLKF